MPLLYHPGLKTFHVAPEGLAALLCDDESGWKPATKAQEKAYLAPDIDAEAPAAPVEK